MAVGLAQARSGRDNQAVLVLGRAVERFPDAPQTHAALGHVWLSIAERRTDRVALVKSIEALTEAATLLDEQQFRVERPGAGVDAVG